MTEVVLSSKEDEIRRFLAFSLGQEEFALPLLSVREVVALPETTRVPYTPPHFLGIMNLRGQVISVFDLRIKLGIKAEKSAETSVIICDLKPLCFGVVVDSVNSVLTLTPKEISSKPQIESRQSSEYITGVTQRESRLILLLDIAKALSVEDKLMMKQAS